MTTKRLKLAHELYCITAFLQWHKYMYRSDYRILDRPDPPDAIICSGGKKCWVELADVYWSDEWAIDVNSYASSEKSHRQIKRQLYCDMDEKFARRFCKVLKKKLEKTTYKAAYDAHGPGYLVICAMSPFFDQDTLRATYILWKSQLRPINKIFRSVLILNPSRIDAGVYRWKAQ